MRKMVFGTLAALFSVSAMGLQAYDCSATLPQGKVRIRGDLRKGGKINVAFHNQQENQTYVGTLRILSNTHGILLAQGTILSYEQHPTIGVTLVGSLSPDLDGVIDLDLYASGDRRVELGYGNPLRCIKR